MFGNRKKGRIEEAEAPVEQCMIMICEKCGYKISGSQDADENPSRIMQKTIKKTVSDAGEKRLIRAVVTSCINVCPKDKIAGAIFSVSAGEQSPTFFEMEIKNPKDAAEELLGYARSRSVKISQKT